MNQRILKKVVIASVAAAVALPAVVFAGSKQSSPVTIGASFFRGSIGSARNSADTRQYIGCGAREGTGFCSAIDANGNAASCTTTNTGQIATIRAISSDSYIDVSFNAGTCVTIFVATYSIYDVPVR